MNNIFKFSIVTSFLGLWIATHIPEKFELILGFILIFSFGMIHGSNDLLIINKILEKSKYYSKFNILVAYLMIVSLAILIFYMAPILALSMFIIFSAYHFGEQHWEKSFIKSNNSLKSVFYFCYGMLILQLLFTFNDIGVKFIVNEITGYQIANLNSFPIIIILGSLVLIMTAIELHFKRISSEIALTELFSLVILTIIFNSSSLIWGFTIESKPSEEGVQGILDLLESKFYISPVLFIVPAVVIFLIIKKVDAVPSLFIGAILGAVVAVIFQPDFTHLICLTNQAYN